MALIVPSILAADFADLKNQVELAESGGADWFHLDVMDGHFVPNISFGPMMIATLRRITTKFLDVHLMIEKPERYIMDFVNAGADLISVHVEACTHLHRTIALIKESGAKAGLAFNPATPLDAVKYLIDDLDLILIMSVNPGFGGQSFIPNISEKIKEAAVLIRGTEKRIYLEVDGGIDSTTAGTALTAGADVLVAGSFVFGSGDILQAVRQLHAIAI